MSYHPDAPKTALFLLDAEDARTRFTHRSPGPLTFYDDATSARIAMAEARGTYQRMVAQGRAVANVNKSYNLDAWLGRIKDAGLDFDYAVVAGFPVLVVGHPVNVTMARTFSRRLPALARTSPDEMKGA